MNNANNLSNETLATLGTYSNGTRTVTAALGEDSWIIVTNSARTLQKSAALWMEQVEALLDQGYSKVG